MTPDEEITLDAIGQHDGSRRGPAARLEPTERRTRSYDLVQETLIRVMTARDRLDPKALVLRACGPNKPKWSPSV